MRLLIAVAAIVTCLPFACLVVRAADSIVSTTTTLITATTTVAPIPTDFPGSWQNQIASLVHLRPQATPINHPCVDDYVVGIACTNVITLECRAEQTEPTECSCKNLRKIYNTCFGMFKCPVEEIGLKKNAYLQESIAQCQLRNFSVDAEPARDSNTDTAPAPKSADSGLQDFGSLLSTVFAELFVLATRVGDQPLCYGGWVSGLTNQSKNVCDSQPIAQCTCQNVHRIFNAWFDDVAFDNSNQSCKEAVQSQKDNLIAAAARMCERQKLPVDAPSSASNAVRLITTCGLSTVMVVILAYFT